MRQDLKLYMGGQLKITFYKVSPIHKSDWAIDIIIVCYLKGSQNGPLFSLKFRLQELLSMIRNE